MSFDLKSAIIKKIEDNDPYFADLVEALEVRLFAQIVESELNERYSKK